MIDWRSEDELMTKLPVKVLIAGAVALFADFLQVILFPLFFEGAASPFDDVLDVAVAGILTALLGWHWVFLPSMAAELVPGLDMAPFWSGAVLYVATKKKAAEPELKSVGSELKPARPISDQA